MKHGKRKLGVRERTSENESEKEWKNKMTERKRGPRVSGKMCRGNKQECIVNSIAFARSHLCFQFVRDT